MTNSCGVFRVSSSANSIKLASAIAAYIKEERRYVELQAIGAGAVNQAIKGVAIAQGYTAPLGIELHVKPVFASVQIDDTQKSQMIMYVHPVINGRIL